MMFLLDTNVFLEVLLGQEKRDRCRDFLNGNIGDLSVTDFTLHSIGVILFRHDKHDLFLEFVDDVMPNVRLLSLPVGSYGDVINAKASFGLDFDDSYQYSVAKCYGLTDSVLSVVSGRHYR